MANRLDQAVAKAEHPHIPALDGLRGIAILLVILRHCTSQIPEPVGRLGTIYNNFVGSLGWGVVLFFVLSGFLITGILLDTRRDKNYFLNFYGRRTLRIFPLYYGTIFAFGVACLFHAFGPDNRLFVHRFPWLAIYTTNLCITWRNDWSFIFNGHSLGHFWSLAVEEQFYLIWPLIVLRCSTGVFKSVCLLAIVGGFAARMFLLYGLHDFLGTIVFLPCQSDSLALGASLAVLVRERRQLVATLAWPCALTGAGIWMATLLDLNQMLTTGISGFAIMSAGTLSLCLFHPVSKCFQLRVLRAFGKYSYGIYVLHVIILPFIAPLEARVGHFAFVLLFTTLSFCAGVCSWYLYEAHFLRLKRFFPSITEHRWNPRAERVVVN
jgi:peptidoglycan/LPS O-acetylase OafA/YrhL